MYLAIAVEAHKGPSKMNEYKVWYLELNPAMEVLGIGVKTKNELIESIFEQYKKSGKSHWRAFLKDSERSIPIEAHDFISRNLEDNTHFGKLATLNEFQSTLDELQLRLEVKALAS